MWNESSSGFGEESPILFKPVKKLSQVPNTYIFLEDVHKKLLLHLKKSRLMSQDTLKSYLEQIKTMDPHDCKSKWLVMKIKGLLKFILKRRCDFQKSIVKGEITIYEKSISSDIFTETFRDTKCSQANSDMSIQMPSYLLSNNNFLTPEKFNVNMEIENSYDFSQDMFSEKLGPLHNLSQENYNIFKNVIFADAYKEEQVIKMASMVNKIDDVFQVHEHLEENYNSLITLTQNMSDSGVLETGMEKMSEESFEVGVNIFDNLTVTNDELKRDFEKELKIISSWISEITYNLKHLRVNESPVTIDSKENAQVLNESSNSVGSLKIKPYYSDENFKIIREACCTFKENLKKSQENAILKELLDLSS